MYGRTSVPTENRISCGIICSSLSTRCAYFFHRKNICDKLENISELRDVIKRLSYFERLKIISMDSSQIYFLFSIREKNSSFVFNFSKLPSTKLNSRYKNFYVSNYLILFSANLIDCQFQLDLIGRNILLNIDHNDNNLLNFFKQCHLPEINLTI